MTSHLLRAHRVLPRPPRTRLVLGISAIAFLLGLPGAARALTSTPFRQLDLSLATTSTVATYQIDLATLPERPRIIVEARPDAAHGDMTIELQITGCTNTRPFLSTCPASVTSPAISGPQTISYKIFECDPSVTFPAYVGETCDVTVRAVSFGTNPGPATIDLEIRGETVVPTSLYSTEVSAAVQTISIEPARDTTIYRPSTTSSNGSGTLLSSHATSNADMRNSLFDFDVAAAVPAGATIVGASVELTLTATTGLPLLDLYAIPRDPSTPWLEGSGVSTDGFTAPLPATSLAATWSHRRWDSRNSVGPWATAGGDRIGPALVSFLVGGRGRVVLTSPALLAHVQLLRSGSTAYDGLLLTATEGGVQIASREHPSVPIRPRLTIQYTPPPTSGTTVTSTLPFFSEAQNFRWIYDTNDDSVLFTPISGRCEMTNFSLTVFNFTYQFLGNASYAGIDCCTWQVGSRIGGVTGAGQLIFYVNASSTDPTYQPTDYDTDGIKDVCDNCPAVPNGPLLGSCTGGGKIGKLCRSNQQCGAGGTCSLAQDDLDRTAPANACVPEPGTVPAIAIGLLLLTRLDARRSRA